MGQVTYDDKVDIEVKADHINQVWDQDMNEIKDAVNDNDARIGVLEAPTVSLEDGEAKSPSSDTIYDYVKQFRSGKWVALYSNSAASNINFDFENSQVIFTDIRLNVAGIYGVTIDETVSIASTDRYISVNFTTGILSAKSVSVIDTEIEYIIACLNPDLSEVNAINYKYFEVNGKTPTVSMADDLDIDNETDAIAWKAVHENITETNQSRVINILDPITQMGVGLSRKQGFDFFIDAYLTGFDNTSDDYGANVIQFTTKTIVIYRVDGSGAVSGSPIVTLSEVETKNNYSRMYGVAVGITASIIVDWNKIPEGDYNGIPSIMFKQDVYHEHYGELSKWEEINELPEGSVVEGNTKAVQGGDIFSFITETNQSRVISVLNAVTEMGSGLTRKEGFDFFIDALLTDFDTSGRYYGASIVKKTSKTITIYEVDSNGLFLNAADPDVMVMESIKDIDNYSILVGSGAYGNAKVLVDWNKIPDGDFLAIPSIRFSDDVYSEHYGELYNTQNLIDTEELSEISEYVEKAGMTEGDDVAVIRTDAIKGYTLTPETFAKRLFSQWMDIVDEKYFNSIRVPIIRAEELVNFTGGVTVRMAINDVWVFRKEITFAELVSFGINTYFPSGNAKDVSERLYTISTGQRVLKSGDVVYIAWSCDESADELMPVYDNSDFTGTPFEGLYKLTSTTAEVDDYTEVPEKTTESSPSSSWVYTPVANLIDYVAKKIEDSGSVKVDEDNVYPDKIYGVCRDIIRSDSGFDSKNFSSVLHVDHFLKLSERKNVVFEDTNTDQYPLFAPIDVSAIYELDSNYNNGNDVNTETKAITLSGDSINDIDLSIDHITTKASITQAEFPKVLVIGDSVTGLFLAKEPTSLTEGKALGYWQYAKHLFQLDKQDAGSGHDALFIGQKNITSFDVNGDTVKAMAEGRGNWDTANYLYDASYDNNDNAFYDSAKVGVKFSITKYLERFKTLSDDGVTRLTVGVDAGTDVTDVNAYDVCTPDIVVIQLGFNDTESNWLTDITLMIDEIKSEYPDMKIIISTIDASGTYYPELYPEYQNADYFGDALHSKMWNLLNSAKGLEDAPNGIYYCPNYFIQPTGIARPYRDVDPPESIHKTDAKLKTEHGTGANYHPNTFAHAAWGYQLYSLIKYILTL